MKGMKRKRGERLREGGSSRHERNMEEALQTEGIIPPPKVK